MNYPMYYLSGRQLHEIDRGYCRYVALPMPATEPENLLIYARDHLSLRRQLVLAAEEDQVTTWPKAGGQGLDSVLGEIVYDQPVPATLTLEIVVIVVTIGSRQRHGTSKIQWPAGAAVADGIWLPRDFKPSKRT